MTHRLLASRVAIPHAAELAHPCVGQRPEADDPPAVGAAAHPVGALAGGVGPRAGERAIEPHAVDPPRRARQRLGPSAPALADRPAALALRRFALIEVRARAVGDVHPHDEALLEQPIGDEAARVVETALAQGVVVRLRGPGDVGPGGSSLSVGLPVLLAAGAAGNGERDDRCDAAPGDHGASSAYARRALTIRL